MLLSLTGNQKLLGAVSFDLPPVVTCPGRSSLCEKYCYAMGGHFRFSAVKRRRGRLLDFFNKYNEVPDIDPKVKPVFARFFVSGDFHCEEMIRAVERFAGKYDHLPMVAFTRSWRIPELNPHLRRLSEVPNMHLWMSTDDETGFPGSRWTRVAYMAVNDKPPARKVDLVFRAFSANPSITAKKRRESPKLWLNGPVCLAQRGLEKGGDKCVACRNCFTQESVKSKKEKQFEGLHTISSTRIDRSENTGGL